MRGLSFDLATASGVALWEGGNALKAWSYTLPAGELGAKLHAWEAEVVRLLHAHQPDWVAYEDARAVSKQHGEILFAMTGILKLHTHRRNIQTLGFSQATVKKALTGHGAAKKPQMLAAARERWPELEVANDNEADALGVGLAFIALVGKEQLEVV